MSEEDGFLGKLLEQPNSDLTRLVYADWLDEQQTPVSLAKAEFLRLIADAELAGKFDARVQSLARKFGTQWLITVGKLPIENCEVALARESDVPVGTLVELGLKFDFDCPKRWDELTPTDDQNVRHCSACQKTVHYCHSLGDLRLNATLERCVAVELDVPRRPGDLEPAGRMFVGGLIPEAIGPEPNPYPVPTRRPERNEEDARGRRKRHRMEEE